MKLVRQARPGQSLPRGPRRCGFTLLELVVVLMIIATIAGFVLPQVASLGRTSDMAATAKTQADLANNLQMFFVLQKRFPQGMDSLITSGGAAIYSPMQADGTTAATLESNQATGLPISGPSLYADLTVGSLTGNYLRSFSRLGFDWVYDHDRTVTNSNNSATVANLRSVPTSSSSTFSVAEITSGSPVALKLMPGTSGILPTGSRLVALGIGPNNSAISKTIINCPVYPGCDGKYYGRYVAVFQLFDTGERGSLIGVVDSYGRAPDYTNQQYNESLPNGGRQG